MRTICLFLPKKPEQQPETNQKPNKNHTKPKQFVRENWVSLCGVAGPMGRPDVLRCRGGDRDTEGATGSSRPGNRPTHASITISKKHFKNLRIKMAQRFAGSCVFRQHPDKDGTGQTYSVSINIHTGTQMHPHIAHTKACVESRCPGEPTRRGLGRSSPDA